MQCTRFIHERLFENWYFKKYLNIMNTNPNVSKTTIKTAEMDPAMVPICVWSSVSSVRYTLKQLKSTTDHIRYIHSKWTIIIIKCSLYDLLYIYTLSINEL